MKNWQKNDGITLVELLVSIAIGATILLAASTVLLLGLRVNHQTTEAVTRQYTARTVLTLMENLVSEGTINLVNQDENGAWKVGIKKTDRETDFEQVLLSYDPAEKAIYTGDSSAGGTIMLENVIASYVVLKDQVLTVSIEDKTENYTTSIYCRTAGASGEYDVSVEPGSAVDRTLDRKYFLNTLISQLGNFGGIIHHSQEPRNQSGDGQAANVACFCKEYNFFSEWYIGGFDANAKVQGWNENTPWCACFVSWGLYGLYVDYASDEDDSTVPLLPPENNEKWFANVDDFMTYFVKSQVDYEKHREQTDQNAPAYEIWTKKTVKPEPGDLIFFNTTSSDEANPSHMGAVLYTEAGEDGWYVITIEGNSADMVAVRKYHMNDSDIIGYGDPWAAQAAAEVMSPKTES